MAAGHIVLQGIGVAVGIAIAATVSHREANRLSTLCQDLEDVNKQNEEALTQAHSDTNVLNQLEEKLWAEGHVFEEELRYAKWKIRRFGWFSHLWRLLRYWIKGFYYSNEEFEAVTRLDAAVVRFVNAFQPDQRTSCERSGSRN